jgi:hypothetical protein
MANPASGPTALLHSAGCPGCAADRTLSDADKTFLDAHGWKHPGHSILPPPEPDPPRYRGRLETTRLLLRRLLAGALGLFVLGAGFSALGPWFLLVLFAGATTWVNYAIRHRARHAAAHLTPGGYDPLCRLCRRAKARDAARRRAHDQLLAAADAATRLRQTNAAHFQRLLHEEHKRRGHA